MKLFTHEENPFEKIDTLIRVQKTSKTKTHLFCVPDPKQLSKELFLGNKIIRGIYKFNITYLLKELQHILILLMQHTKPNKHRELQENMLFQSNAFNKIL
jgi:hypothetical protein